MQTSQQQQHLERLSAILSLVLRNPQLNALHDASTFSRLLCVNKQLHTSLLNDAVSHLVVDWSRQAPPTAVSNMILWLQQHMRLGTLKHVVLFQDALSVPLHEFNTIVKAAAAVSKARQAFVNRVACALGSAAAYLGTQPLPLVQGWYSCGKLWWDVKLRNQAAAGCQYMSDRHAAKQSNWITCCLMFLCSSLSPPPPPSPSPPNPLPSFWLLCACMFVSVLCTINADLPAASLSQLAGSHLTQLILTASSSADFDAAAAELAALTGLRELRLPMLGPAPASLAPVLSALTGLTGLLLANPVQEVIDSMPTSVQKLVLALGHQPAHAKAAVHLKHLKQLRTLHLVSPLVAATVAVMEFADDYDAESSGLTDDIILPCSLQRVVVNRLHSVRPLQGLTQLDTVTLTHGAFDAAELVMQLSSLTSLTAVVLAQPSSESITLTSLPTHVTLYRHLPLVVPHLTVDVPTTATGVAPALFRALGSLTTLTGLQLRRQKARRAAAILTAAAAAGGNAVGEGAFDGTVQQLAGALSALTNLRSLGLRQLPLVTQAKVAAVSLDWEPVAAAAAGLPNLQHLHVEGMPWGASVAALSSAGHLSSLHLINCQLDDSAAVRMVTGMRCSSCLQALTIAAPVTAAGPLLSDVALTSIIECLPQLRRLRLRHHQFSPACVVEVTRSIEEVVVV